MAGTGVSWGEPHQKGQGLLCCRAAPGRGDLLLPEKPDTRVFVGSLPGFKYRQQIQISEPYSAKRKKTAPGCPCATSADWTCQSGVCWEAGGAA